MDLTSTFVGACAGGWVDLDSLIFFTNKKEKITWPICQGLGESKQAVGLRVGFGELRVRWTDTTSCGSSPSKARGEWRFIEETFFSWCFIHHIELLAKLNCGKLHTTQHMKSRDWKLGARFWGLKMTQIGIFGPLLGLNNPFHLFSHHIFYLTGPMKEPSSIFPGVESFTESTWC